LQQSKQTGGSPCIRISLSRNRARDAIESGRRILDPEQRYLGLVGRSVRAPVAAKTLYLIEIFGVSGRS
jgi:hypothetical protein